MTRVIGRSTVRGLGDDIGARADFDRTDIRYNRSYEEFMSLTDQHLPSGSQGASWRRREVRPATIARDAAAAPLYTGRSFPLGATVLPGGVNFSVFSRQATRVELLLFDGAEEYSPTHAIDLEPRVHRTYHYWHLFVPGIGPGQLYAYRADRPFRSDRGLRFDPSKVLLDPYGRAVVVPEDTLASWRADTGKNMRSR